MNLLQARQKYFKNSRFFAMHCEKIKTQTFTFQYFAPEKRQLIGCFFKLTSLEFVHVMMTNEQPFVIKIIIYEWSCPTFYFMKYRPM